MKIRSTICAISLILLSCDPSSPVETTINDRLQASDSVTILAPQTISSPLPEFATSVSADGTELFFNRTSADRSEMQIFQSNWKDGKWSAPQPLPFSDGQYRDVDPFITQDGSRLYFSSNRPTEYSEDAYNHWYVIRQEEEWSAPQLAPKPLNSDSSDIYITLAANGNAYFRTGRFGGRDIVKSEFINGTYREPEPIQFAIDGNPVYASNPAISSDEEFMIVFSPNPEDATNMDLFITWNMGGRWSELQHLGPKVNSPYTEFAPALSKDDRTLYFTSEQPGVVPAPEDSTARPPGDLYQVDLRTVVPGFLQADQAREVRFSAADGLTIHGDLYEVDKARPVILLFHQGGSNARGEYTPIIPELLAASYNILAIDQRQGGQRYGYFNRTVARNAFQDFSYCDAYPDLIAALDFVVESGFTGQKILWGSSYSAALAIRLAHERPGQIAGVMAFSPASGTAMEGCQPNDLFQNLRVPLLLLRPALERDREIVQRQFELAQKYNHQVYTAANGVHGSSLLVAHRTEGTVEPQWKVVRSFLERIAN